MFRANIYSLEPLEPVAREAVHEGIEMIAAYMGQTVTTSELQVRLPLDDNRLVNPRRVGFKKLDKMVELHLMAVPVDPGESELLGVAGVGLGWGFTDISSNHPSLMRSTASHETAHAFGFVMADSKQSDPESSTHCISSNCIMHSKAIYQVVHTERLIEPARSRGISRLIHLPNSQETPAVEISTHREYLQHDFCVDCKSDMYNYGEKNLARLRHRRVFTRNRV